MKKQQCLQSSLVSLLQVLSQYNPRLCQHTAEELHHKPVSLVFPSFSSIQLHFTFSSVSLRHPKAFMYLQMKDN